MKTSELVKEAVEIKREELASIHTCVVLAPHPDDESLGCGGVIALLHEMGKEIHVIFTTDGSSSHPHSRRYPADKLAALRREEALAALDVLGVPAGHVFFLNKKDGALPAEGEAEFEHNAEQLHLLLQLLRPGLVLVPYEKDPHRDHRATWQMLMYAHSHPKPVYRVLEYLIWLHERGGADEMPEAKTVRFVNITPWQTRKQRAIHEHVSQTTGLIDDDPEGFTLSPEVLSHFSSNKEYFLDRNL